MAVDEAIATDAGSDTEELLRLWIGRAVTAVILFLSWYYLVSTTNNSSGHRVGRGGSNTVRWRDDIDDLHLTEEDTDKHVSFKDTETDKIADDKKKSNSRKIDLDAVRKAESVLLRSPSNRDNETNSNKEEPASEDDSTDQVQSPPALAVVTDREDSRRVPQEDKSSEKEESDPPPVSKAASTQSLLPSRSSQQSTPAVARPVVFSPSATDVHPGLNAFWYWCDIECSLFRIYTIERNDGQSEAPPYNPSSRRGTVPVHLRVTNDMNYPITVNWVNFKGREERKGIIRPGNLFTQHTWIDHPWVFRDADEQILMHYIPYRVIPTTESVSTVDQENEGVHEFSIKPAWEPWRCRVFDPVLPFPARDHVTTPDQAVSWTLNHCLRMSYSGWDILRKYLTKISQDPANPRYRQLRTANPIFGPMVWQTPAKGLLLALGFVEAGAFAELGTMEDLPDLRVADVQRLLYYVEQYHRQAQDGQAVIAQPFGADGFGRAGFGRAGSINNQGS